MFGRSSPEKYCDIFFFHLIFFLLHTGRSDQALEVFAAVLSLYHTSFCLYRKQAGPALSDDRSADICREGGPSAPCCLAPGEMIR